MKVYFAADHAGFDLKNRLLSFVRDTLGYQVEDCGAFELDQGDDYPGIMARAATSLSADVKAGLDNRAILIGASGQGEAMAANRFKQIRAALYYGAPLEVTQIDADAKELDMIGSTRKHNNANALCLGARFISNTDAEAVVQNWLSESFSGEERHVRRIEALDSIG